MERVKVPNSQEEIAKLREEQSKEAIALALRGNWERATEVNRRILMVFPEDVEALNRLGKAFLELGRYMEAKNAFESAVKLAPYNTISKKNIERLAHLQETEPTPKQGKVITPYLFIEESGKSGVTMLETPAPRQVLAKMAAGDSVHLECRDHLLMALNDLSEYLGQVEPKLGLRLARLMKGGNRYDAAVISVHRQEISIIIWEAHRDPSLDGVCSFPTRSKDEYKGYLRDALLRYDLEAGSEDEEFGGGWAAPYGDDRGLTDGDGPASPMGSSEEPTPPEEEEE